MNAKVLVLPDPVIDPWPVLWASFERALRAEDRSVNTLEVYAHGGHQFHVFLLERSLPTDPASINKGMVEEFLIALREVKRAKPATVSVRFSALRRFFSWLVEEGEIEHSPMERMHRQHAETPPPEILTEDEQRRLLAACSGQDFEARRDTAILRLMLDSGLRRGEVASITLEDLDLDNQVVRVVGKGRREGVGFFGAKTARDLDRYLRLRPHHRLASLPSLWLAQKGPLTGDGIHYLIQRRAEKAGIKKNVHPHLTRHSWAHSLKMMGASDEDVMTLGRWRDRTVMARYGQSAALERARSTHRRLSPGDRL